jgi:hypothetical protein
MRSLYTSKGKQMFLMGWSRISNYLYSLRLELSSVIQDATTRSSSQAVTMDRASAAFNRLTGYSDVELRKQNVLEHDLQVSKSKAEAQK